MSTMPAPITERKAHLKGAYVHLATKADLVELELRLTQQMAQMESRMAQLETRMTWRLIGASGAIIAAVALIVRFL